MWLGSIEIGSLGLLNTLPLDHKSGSPESQLGLLPDIKKPPLDHGGGRGTLRWERAPAISLQRNLAVLDDRQWRVVVVYAVWRLRFWVAHIPRPFHVAGGRARRYQPVVAGPVLVGHRLRVLLL